MKKITWFLDVDGVLNAVGNEDHLSPGWQREVINGFVITWHPDIIERVMKLSERVQIRWLTTWCQDANTHIVPALGMSSFPLAADTAWESSVGWWKSKPVQDFVSRNPGPFIWTDDDLFYTPSEFARWEDHPALLIAPDDQCGLSHRNLDEIERFITQHE